MLKALLWIAVIIVYSAVLVGNAGPIKESIQDAANNMNMPAVTDALDSFGLLPSSPAPMDNNYNSYNSTPRT